MDLDKLEDFLNKKIFKVERAKDAKTRLGYQNLQYRKMQEKKDKLQKRFFASQEPLERQINRFWTKLNAKVDKEFQLKFKSLRKFRRELDRLRVLENESPEFRDEAENLLNQIEDFKVEEDARGKD